MTSRDAGVTICDSSAQKSQRPLSLIICQRVRSTMQNTVHLSNPIARKNDLQDADNARCTRPFVTRVTTYSAARNFHFQILARFYHIRMNTKGNTKVHIVKKCCQIYVSNTWFIYWSCCNYVHVARLEFDLLSLMKVSLVERFWWALPRLVTHTVCV